MPFSSFVWKLYIASEEGRSAIARDLAEHAAAFSPSPRTPPFEFALYSAPLENGEVSGPVTQVDNSTVDLRSLFRSNYSGHELSTLEEAEHLFTSIADEGLEWRIDLDKEKRAFVYGGGKIDVSAYEDIILSIQGLSSGMHEAFPEFFFPYLFSCSFDRLQRIGDRFGISLPEIPGRRKVRDRALYYLHVNREMQRFRREHGLSPAELNAFLYDFTEKEMGDRSPAGFLVLRKFGFSWAARVATEISSFSTRRKRVLYRIGRQAWKPVEAIWRWYGAFRREALCIRYGESSTTVSTTPTFSSTLPYE